jgi:uncharacterized protein YgiM (DUF1202 family)
VVSCSPSSRVNVRGQAKLRSEIVTHMTNGEPVVVLEEITLARSAADEPSAWAKIILPEKARVWVNTFYIDLENMTVKAKKLNVRSGPGENYSVVGSVQQGDALKDLSRRGAWMEIEPPGNAYAFMAAQYLKQEPVPETTVAVTEPPPTTTSVTEATPVTSATTETPVVDAMTATNETAVSATGEAGMTDAPPVEEPPPPRIVQREGIVRGTFSIQAPTQYELINPENRRTINYLYTTAPGLDLSRYKGLHIIVTGEEGLDERWKNTPVITIQRIHVLD